MLYVAGGQTADSPPILYNQVSRYDYTTNTWSNVAPLPVAIGQGAMGAWNGKVYVAGGFIGGTSVTNALHIYDIASNIWTGGANMPTSPGVEAAAGAVVNGKFYVMGGDDFNNGLNTNFIYDIATDTWSTGTTLPDNRTNTYGTAYNGLIYVYGGEILPFTAVDTLLRYDPMADSWTNLGSAGTGGLGIYGGISPFGTGQLLITDGENNFGGFTKTTHIFTISSGTFSAGPAMIDYRAGHAQGTLPDGRVLVADGFGPTFSGTVSTVELLTTPPPCPSVTPTGTPTPTCIPGVAPWTIVANYPVVVESAAVSTDGTYVYSAGGFVINAASNAFYRYNPATDTTWTPLASMPTAVYDAHAAYAANVNKSYVFGGFNGSTVVKTTQIYDVATDTWTTGADMPDFRRWPNVAYYSGNGKIYVIGGFDSSFNEQGQTWEYDPVANTWDTSRVPDPVPQGGANAVISGQFIYLAGGSFGSTTHYRYDIVSNTWALMAPLPVPNFEAGAGNIDGKNYIFGGGNPFLAGPGNIKGKSNVNAPATTYNSTYIYDIASDSWTTGPNLNVPHSYTGGTAIGNRLLIVAGYNGMTDTNTVETTTVCGANTKAYTQTDADAGLHAFLHILRRHWHAGTRSD